MTSAPSRRTAAIALLLLSCRDQGVVRAALDSDGPRGAVHVEAARSSNGILRIAVGTEAACVVRGDGSLSCWGSNRFGQVGDGTTTRRDEPVRINVPGGARDVAVAHNLACAVTRAGKVACWGSRKMPPFRDVNTEGVPPAELVPSVVEGLDRVRSVGVGSTHVCALREDGSVWCWGQSSNGQVGGPPRRDEIAAPARVEGVSGARALDVADDSSCVVLSDRTAACWGANPDGLLGQQSATVGDVRTIEGLRDIERLAIGGHTCAVVRDHTIRCWGSNQFREVGTLQGSGNVLRPTPVPGIDTAVDVTVGQYHTCARLLDASVMCWGWTRADRTLAEGQQDPTTPPLVIPGLRATEIATGGRSSCATIGTEEVWCWGGRIGSQRQGDGSPTPTRISAP